MTLSKEDLKILSTMLFTIGLCMFLSGLLFAAIGMITIQVLFAGDIIPVGIMIIGIGIKLIYGD